MYPNRHYHQLRTVAHTLEVQSQQIVQMMMAQMLVEMMAEGLLLVVAAGVADVAETEISHDDPDP